MIKKTIRSILWAFVLFILAIAITALVMPDPSVCRTCGVQISSTLWLMGMAAVFPAIWIDGPSFLQKFYASSVAAVSGIAVYYALEYSALLFVTATDNFQLGLMIGLASNLLGLGIAFVISRAMMKKYTLENETAMREVVETQPEQ